MESPTDPLVVTVILNTNRREDTLACLASLAQSPYPHHQIMVLDNASTDGSAEAIAAAFPDVTLLPLTANKGYAGNNNVGIAAALEMGADWVFVLNEDTLLAPDCIGKLVAVGEADPRIGVVGPMVYHYNEPEVIQSAGGRMTPKMEAFHIAENEPDRGQFSAPVEVDWISGCAILVRRSVIEQVGALDERFFYYWEETEWCLRARRAGWRVIFAPQAKLWHKGVQRDYKPSANVTYYSTRNRLLMMQKHQAPLWVKLAAWGQIGRTLVSWTVKPKWRDMRLHRDAMWQGALDYLHGRWGIRPSA
jgi:GT2 family glycosyltransferase